MAPTAPTATQPAPGAGLTGPGWDPGTYLARHCPGSTGSGLVTAADGGDCRADLMMEIGMGAGVVRDEESSGQVYGVSQYLRLFDFMDRYPDTGQFGLWGQWIGSNGAHPNGHFNSIEGGLFVHYKMGRSRFPRYMASAATHLYSAVSDTGGGWGFNERRIDCSVLGRITITNKMLVPPNLIAFDADQDVEGGAFIGTSWVALPLIGGAERFDEQPHGPDQGLLTWTFILDSANHRGPLIAYVPEHWARRVDRWNAMEVLDDVYGWDLSDPTAVALGSFVDGDTGTKELHEAIADESWYGGPAGDKDFGSPHWVRSRDTLGYSPASAYLPTGPEMPPVPVFRVDGPDGRIFLKVFPPDIPNAAAREPFALNIQTFDVDLYNSFLGALASADGFDPDAVFNGLGIPMQVEEQGTSPWRGIELAQLEPFEDAFEANLVLRVPMGAADEDGETNVYFEWGDSAPDERGWTTYYEVVDSQLSPVADEVVPQELRELRYHTLQETTSLMSPADPSSGLDTSCWSCTDPTGCDPTLYQAVLDDGSLITYRWQRFIDQPAFHHLRLEYPDEYSEPALAKLQGVVEAMHTEWSGQHELLERPAGIGPENLAEVDHGLLVEPPTGRKAGWVPVVLEVEQPDGVWQDEVDWRETADGRLVMR